MCSSWVQGAVPTSKGARASGRVYMSNLTQSVLCAADATSFKNAHLTLTLSSSRSSLDHLPGPAGVSRCGWDCRTSWLRGPCSSASCPGASGVAARSRLVWLGPSPCLRGGAPCGGFVLRGQDVGVHSRCSVGKGTPDALLSGAFWGGCGTRAGLASQLGDPPAPEGGEGLQRRGPGTRRGRGSCSGEPGLGRRST